MNTSRIVSLKRGVAFTIMVDGQAVTAYSGETVATALLASGFNTFQHAQEGNQPSRIFCSMGVCMQCLVTVDDQPSCRACQTLAKANMKVETHHDES